jgi:subtilisin family serine protease
MPSRFPAAAAAALVLALAGAAPAAPPAPAGDLLVQLAPAAACAEAHGLVAAGATALAPGLRLYRLPAARAPAVLPGLRARGAVTLVEEDRPVGTLQTFTDSLTLADDWWRVAIGADGLAPPGPGTPVSIVDSGVSLGHPEFAGRPDTEALNPQEPAPLGGQHGTAVASLIGAPANGVGIVGLYPQAVLRTYDAAGGEGLRLLAGDIVQGITEAARRGRGVINLSLGSGDRSSSIEGAVNEAVRRGSLVVAAAGNDGDRGNPLTYPASLPHVLTVAATDRANAVAPFSSRSRWVDLAAPGDGVTVADALSGDYTTQSGTSFAAPLVSAAAAWLWTVRPELDASQVFEVLRRSARDIGPPGRDLDSGFGLLDVRSALAYPAPTTDPLEPNEDIDDVRPGFGLAALTTTGTPRRVIAARLDVWEDPRDVYRVWQPRGKALVISTGSSEDVDVAVWSEAAFSVAQRPGRERLASSARPDLGNERTRVPAVQRGRWVYVAVSRGRGIAQAEYRLGITPR